MAVGLLSTLRQDVIALSELKAAGQPAALTPRGLLDVLGLPGIWPVVLHRFAHAAQGHGWGLLAQILRQLAATVFGTDIHPRARIGPGLTLAHPTGVTIGPVVVGRDARLMAHVCLGGPSVEEPFAASSVVIGDACWFFDGAKITGGARVGDGAVVGTDTVVDRDVAPRAVVVGSPARVVRWRDPGVLA